MSTTSGVEEVARKVLELLRKEDKSLNWLAQTADVPHSTLSRQLNRRPDQLTLSTLLRVAAALNVPLSALLGGTE